MAFNAAMIRRRSGWWMMSSSSAIALAPAHPEPAPHEPVADEEIADQRQGGDAKPDGDKRCADPQPNDGVDQHEIEWPERVHLTCCEVPETKRPEIAETQEQQERRQEAGVKSPHAGTGARRSADGERAGGPKHGHHKPDQERVPRQNMRNQVASEHQRAPHDQHQACEVVDPRLADAARNLVDLVQRRGSVPGIDTDHDPLPAFTTSSAIADTAAGSLT